VTLYVMLVGAYPFEDHTDPRNFSKTIKVCLQCALQVLNHPNRRCWHCCADGRPLQLLVRRYDLDHAADLLSNLCLTFAVHRGALVLVYHLQRILAVKYSIPTALRISPECQVRAASCGGAADYLLSARHQSDSLCSMLVTDLHFISLCSTTRSIA